MKRTITIVLTAILCQLAYTQTLDRDTFLIGEVDISAKLQFEQKPSALKTIAPLKHIPLATSSINRKMLDYRSVNNINDAMRYATGVRSTVNYGGFQTFRFRGFGSPVIMVDGARDERMNWSNSAPITSLTAVESIEFLKGPASVMYGHSAVGGILNIVRKQPTQRSTANARIGYGTWNNKRTEVGVGGALSPKLSYRFDAGYADSDGWRDNTNKTANAYLAFDWQPTDNNVFKFRLGANDDFYGTETGMPAVTNNIFSSTTNVQEYKAGDLPEGFKREQRYNDPSDFLKHNNYNASIAWEHNFNSSSKLINSVSYNDDDIDYFSTEELSYLTSDKPIYKHYYMNGDSKQYICLDSLQRTFPLRFSHKTKTLQYNIDYYKQFHTGSFKHNVVAGYNLMYVDRISDKGYDVGNDVYGDGLFATISVVDPILNQGYLKTKFSGAAVMNDMSNGFYFQDLIDINKQLKVMLGGRFDFYNYARRDALVTSGLDYEFTDENLENTITNKAFSYRAGLVYLPSDNLSLYTSVSSFFKPYRSVFNPSNIYINKNGERFYPADGEEVYAPEQGYQAEMGFKWELNNVLSINGSTYYILKQNIVEYLGRTEENKRIYGQVGEVDSKGFELDVKARPSKGLFITAGYSFNQTQYRDFANNPYVNGNDIKGNSFVHTPENQLFTWINYTITSGIFTNFSLGAGTRFTDDVYTNSSNTMVLSSYWVSDASIAYTFDNLTLRFNANNLTDEYYIDNTVYSNQYIPGMGRSCEISLSLKL